jgi:hypothetical protein
MYRRKLTNSSEARQKRPMAEKKSWDKNLDAASGITFRSQEVFSKSTQKLYIYFALCEGIQ